MGDASKEPTQRIHALNPDAPACVHHWLLGEPAGDQIPGRCKRCGAQRVYSNSIEGTSRFDDYREITSSSEYYVQRASA